MLGSNRHSLDIQYDLRRLRRLFFHYKINIPSDHHGRQLFRRCIFDLYGTDIFSFADHAAGIRGLHNLRQLMGNKKDALAFSSQIFHNRQKLLNFLRRQNSCRFVKDQDLVVAKKHL